MSPRRNVQATSNIKPLPIELIISILQEAQYDDLVSRYKWLKRYALVCHAWSIHAQQLLFTHVALLQGTRQCRTFLRSVASAQKHNPARAALLQASARILVMTVDHQSIYADVIALCPHLRELRVFLYHASFRPEVLQCFSKIAHMKSLQALRVRSYHYKPLFQLLALLPGLEYLEVHCNGVLGLSLVLPTYPPPAWRLRELRYKNSRRDTHAFVEWALSGSKTTLEVLRVVCASFELSRFVAMGIAPTLRSLSMAHLHTGDEAALAEMAHLEEIAIAQPHGLSQPFASLPSGIVHVALDAMRSDDCIAVIAGLSVYWNTMRGSERRSLRVVTYSRHGDADEDPDALEVVRMLYEFCREREIEFRLMEPPHGHYAGELIPLKQVLTFPQPIPLSVRRPSHLDEKALPWIARSKASFARRFVGTAKKAFGSTIPPVALARP